MSVHDDGPGRPVTQDQPYYAIGTRPGQQLLAHCHRCGEMVPVQTDDYRWFVMRAVKSGWRLAKLTGGDQWTCPACAAAARAGVERAIRENGAKEE